MTLVTRQSMIDDSGTFTDGTAINKAFVDQLYDQLDDQAHSTTNPTIKPKATTDEVVTARGSKATLDARLDVSLNEDGTLKTPASLATSAQLAAAISARDLALNAALTDWESGASAAPLFFTLTGSGATIVRTGAGEADTFSFGTGQYAARVTRVGNDWKLTQVILSAADYANFSNVKGRKFAVGFMGKTSVPNHLRIVVDDGVSTTASAFHAGDGVAAFLSALHTISNSATKLDVYVEGVGSNGDAYVGGFISVFSDVVPVRFIPVRDQYQTVSRFGRILFKSDAEVVATARPIGRSYQDATDHGNSAGVMTDLATRTLPANTMADGTTVRYLAAGILAANGNTKTIEAHFGSTSVQLYNAAGNNIHWFVEIIVVRLTSTTQRMIATITISGGSNAMYATPAETLTGTVVVKLRGNGAGANDVVQKMFVETIG